MHLEELPKKKLESAREGSLPYQITFASNLLRTVLNLRFQKNDIDITPEQLMILDFLNEYKEKVSMQSISDVLHRDNSAITRAIDSLVKKNYVKKVFTKTDRRKRLISITEEGNHVYCKAIKEASAHIKEALSGLSSEQIQEMFINLNIIKTNMIKLKDK